MSKEYPCVHWVDGICKLHSGREITSWCVEAPCADQKPSNADRIRSMTDEELAEVIRNGISSDACDYCEHNNGHCDGSPCRGEAEADIIIKWLQQPAED